MLRQCIYTSIRIIRIITTYIFHVIHGSYVIDSYYINKNLESRMAIIPTPKSRSVVIHICKQRRLLSPKSFEEKVPIALCV